MAKTLIEVFTERKKRKRISVNRAARSKGSRAEALLLRQLEQQGYEVRRTHLSLFPDIIAWKENDLLMIEVKQRADAKILCYLRVNDNWSAFQYINNSVIPVELVVNKET
jgi:uncharacterized circularly permuted ATP-grasp superfamily protein